MTDRNTLLSLAARVEAAVGGDRELDCLIWAEVTEQRVVWTGADNHLLIIGDSAIGSVDPSPRSGRRNFSCNRQATGPNSIPAYTASLDAAMTLVGEWIYIEHRRFDDGSFGCEIEVIGVRVATISASAATPALALTAAALRARAVLSGEEG